MANMIAYGCHRVPGLELRMVRSPGEVLAF